MGKGRRPEVTHFQTGTKKHLWNYEKQPRPRRIGNPFFITMQGTRLTKSGLSAIPTTKSTPKFRGFNWRITNTIDGGLNSGALPSCATLRFINNLHKFGTIVDTIAVTYCVHNIPKRGNDGVEGIPTAFFEFNNPMKKKASFNKLLAVIWTGFVETEIATISTSIYRRAKKNTPSLIVNGVLNPW